MYFYYKKKNNKKNYKREISKISDFQKASSCEKKSEALNLEIYSQMAKNDYDYC